MPSQLHETPCLQDVAWTITQGLYDKTATMRATEHAAGSLQASAIASLASLKQVLEKGRPRQETQRSSLYSSVLIGSVLFHGPLEPQPQVFWLRWSPEQLLQTSMARTSIGPPARFFPTTAGCLPQTPRRPGEHQSLVQGLLRGDDRLV